ncbi:MAG: thioesterase family protein [Actinomycetota bacterium]|nr:thioesterase family protein [Actinomycetota bacterium]
MSGVPDLQQILAVRPTSTDQFIADYQAPSARSLNGGQMAGQALNSAFATVDERLDANAVHVFFLNAGDPLKPVEFEVQRERDSRAFSTRQVLAHQGDRLIARVGISFHAPEGGENVQIPTSPAVAEPEDCELAPSRCPGFEVRVPKQAADYLYEPRLWARPVHELGNNRRLNSCALIYLSDLHSGIPQLTDLTDEDFHTSLDHAIWLHRTPKMDDWILMDHQGESLADGRGWYRGRFYGHDGQLVASMGQEMLLRPATRD